MSDKESLLSAPSFPEWTKKVDLSEEIVLRRERRLRGKASAYPRNNPIASDIDPDSCLRRQVLEIVAWQDKPLSDDPWLQGLFEAGREAETQAVRWLMEDGFNVMHQQVPFELKHRQTGQLCLRGNIDGAIEWEGKKPKFEVKLVPPWDLDKITSIEDLLQDRWKKRYVAQMQAYLIGHGEEQGLFIFLNGRGGLRTIPVDLDYELAERVWQFAEKIVDAVRIYKEYDTIYDRGPYLPDFTEDQDQCESCAFFGRTCNPEIKNVGALALESGELELLLSEREQLAEQGKRYKKLDEAVKKHLKKLQEEMGPNPRRLIVGAFTVEWGKRHYHKKVIEPEVKPAYDVWVPKIKYVGA
jgi:hypothetical protein